MWSPFIIYWSYSVEDSADKELEKCGMEKEVLKVPEAPLLPAQLSREKVIESV